MKEILKKGLKELGIAPPDAQMDAQLESFDVYLSELKRWSKAYSLTSLKTDEEIIVKHFLDSCLYIVALENAIKNPPLTPPRRGIGEAPPSMGQGRTTLALADVGSGAGFPGIPIKIIRPELDVYLIEPTRKKAAFLRHIVRTLGLENISVIEKRVEGVSDIEVDAALTRALFDTEEFVKKAGHIVRDGGVFILSKGPKVKEELNGLGLDYELEVLELPLSDIKRYFVLIKKNGGLGDCVHERKVTAGGYSNKTKCVNAECRLRRAGCRGFEGCPGFLGR